MNPLITVPTRSLVFFFRKGSMNAIVVLNHHGASIIKIIFKRAGYPSCNKQLCNQPYTKSSLYTVTCSKFRTDWLNLRSKLANPDPAMSTSRTTPFFCVSSLDKKSCKKFHYQSNLCLNYLLGGPKTGGPYLLIAASSCNTRHCMAVTLLSVEGWCLLTVNSNS